MIYLRIDQPAKNSPIPGIVVKSFALGIGFGPGPNGGFRLFDPPVDVADEVQATVDLDAINLRTST